MVNELRAVIQELGGERALGRRLLSDRDLREAIRQGFPPAVVEELMRAFAKAVRRKPLAFAADAVGLWELHVGEGGARLR